MSSSLFREFAREWGGLLVQDPSASLEHLFDVFRSAEAATARPATIEDFTDLWTAAKRANKEWEATCMVRSVRQSVALDGAAMTAFHLMTAMTCWAATVHQRAPDFFKGCKAQVRGCVAQVMQRCTLCAGEEDTPYLYQEVAFCAALELFGWHNSLLTCLQTLTVQQAEPANEQDVLLYIAAVGQLLTPATLPRGFSTESSPGITSTGRTSALSSSSEHDGATGKEDTMTGTDYLTSPSWRYPTKEDSASRRVHVEPNRCVGSSGTSNAGDSASLRINSPSSPSAPPYAPPSRAPTMAATQGKPLNRPQQAPRSRGTPLPSPKNFGTPVPTPTNRNPSQEAAVAVAPTVVTVAAVPAPPPLYGRANSATTIASTEKSRSRDEGGARSKRSSGLKKSRAAASKDNQQCVAF